MAMDGKGNNHKAAGRPDGGQFDRKAGQGTDDDLEETAAPEIPAWDRIRDTDDSREALLELARAMSSWDARATGPMRPSRRSSCPSWASTRPPP